MRIKRIAVQKYKNLVDFECDFSGSNISAFIGNNGSGKSNLLEVITIVFSVAKKHATDNAQKLIYFPDIWGCAIEYEFEGMDYVLKYSKSNVEVFSGDKKLTKAQINTVLPDAILVYYAGETQRQKITATNVFDAAYNSKLKISSNDSFPGHKFMDYFNTEDLSSLLLTAAIYKGEYYENLLSLLKCSELMGSTRLMLKDPNPKSKGVGADTYWNARGFVKSFLERMRKHVSKTIDLGTLYLMSFDDIAPLKETSNSETEFFLKLKALKNAGYIDSISVDLKRMSTDEVFSYEDLSEGEKQLSLLYLLTTFTANDHCLYIFDEFDSYLHLNWQRSVSEMISDIHVNGHVIYTTHSPATISQVKSDDLFIMQDGKVDYPDSETFNRALDEIMLEQMGISMRHPEIEKLYDDFKKYIAQRDRENAQAVVQKLHTILDQSDPLFLKTNMLLRRI